MGLIIGNEIKDNTMYFPKAPKYEGHLESFIVVTD